MGGESAVPSGTGFGLSNDELDFDLPDGEPGFDPSDGELEIGPPRLFGTGSDVSRTAGAFDGTGEGPGAFGFADDPFDLADPDAGSSGFGIVGGDDSARLDAALGEPDGIGPDGPDLPHPELGFTDGGDALALDSALGASSAVRAFTERADVAGERYLTPDGAIEDVARRANRWGDAVGLETTYAVYKDADGMFVPTRTRLGQQKSVDSAASVRSTMLGERTPEAYGHSHVYYMLGDQTPTYDKDASYVNSNRHSIEDLTGLETATRWVAKDHRIPNTISSVVATPDGSILKATGTYSGPQLTEMTVPESTSTRSRERPGALVHQPRAAGDPDPAQGPDAPPTRRGPFPYLDGVQDGKDYQSFLKHYDESITALPKHVPENLFRAGERGAQVGAFASGGVSLTQALADGRIDDSEAVRVVGDTFAGAAVGGTGNALENVVAREIDDLVGLGVQGNVAKTVERFSGKTVPLPNDTVLIPKPPPGHAVGTAARHLFADVGSASVVGGGVGMTYSIGRNLEGLGRGDSEAFGNVVADGIGSAGSGALSSLVAVGASGLVNAQRGSAAGWPGTLAGLTVGIGTGVAVEAGYDASGAKRWVGETVADGIDANKAAVGETVQELNERGPEVVDTVGSTARQIGRTATATAGNVVEGVRGGAEGVRRGGVGFVQGLGAAAGQVKDGAEQVVETGTEVVGDARRRGSEAVGATREAAGDALRRGREGFDAAKEATGDAWGTVRGWFGGGR